MTHAPPTKGPSLEHQRTEAIARQIERSDEPIVAATDNDHVMDRTSSPTSPDD